MMSNSLDQFEKFYAKNRREWRQWLKEHHNSSPGVWLIYYKKNSDKPRVDYEEAVEEALSFGWIDSKSKVLDEERYMQVFTPRKPGSAWSRSNKERVKKLVKNGLMKPAGLVKIDAAKKDGSWTILDDVEDLVIPEDLKNILEKNKAANENFEAFSDSAKKQVLYWIVNAKRKDTRLRRIKKTVEFAAKNKKPFN
jgi:uncharacterized protein YdeI (YjbR/CyaY-like superfamily)